MSRQAAADFEVFEIPPENLYVELLDSGNASNAKGASQRTWPHFRHCLRVLRLQFINLVFERLVSWKSSTEHRKVAMYRKRRVAASHVLLQLFPLGGAIVLLILQWTKYWIGIQTNVSTFLQFTAKFHELTMQASLVEILLCVIRTNIVNGYIPLGALSSTTQATQLSYLWSLDFISTFKSPAFKGWQRTVFLLVILTIVPLTSLVGPSSAILMIPRPDTPHIVQEYNWYLPNSTDDVYPSSLSQHNGLIIDLLNLETTIASRRTQVFLNEEQGSLIDMIASEECDSYLQRSLRQSFFYNQDYVESNTTLPTCLNSELFIMSGADWRRLYRGVGNRTTILLQTLHPVVSTRCTTKSMRKSDDIFYVRENRTLGVLFNTQTLVDRVSNFTGSSNATLRVPGLSLPEDSEKVFYPPIWMSSPESSSSSLIGVFASWEGFAQQDELPHSLPWILTQPESYRSSLYVTTCTISAYWNNGESQLIERSGEMVVQTRESPRSEPYKARPITLDLTGIHTVQTPEFLRDMASSIGGIGYDFGIPFALAIAQIPIDHVDPSSEMPPNFNEHNMTVFKGNTFVYGYGYGSRSTSVQLAILVMITYCVIATAYSGYILVTGSTSTAWNSTIELVALALQSKKPDYLGHISVGIDSIETMKEGVRICANQDNELEMIFAHDRDIDKRDLRKIQSNKEY